MPLAMSKRTLAKVRFYGVFVILAASVWAVGHYANRLIFGVPGTIFGVTDPSTSADWSSITVKAMTDINALLTSLATALLGAIGLLIANAGNSSKTAHTWAAFLAAISGGVSLYCGYECHCFVLTMITNQTFFGTYEDAYLIYKNIQFFALLAGALFLADFAFHGLSEDAVAKTKEKST
jgi:hypothetical protein